MPHAPRALPVAQHAAIQLGMELGEQSVVDDGAASFGITTPIPPYPSINIGSADVYPIEMVAAYSTFATLGMRTRRQPRSSAWKTRKGRCSGQPEPQREQVLSREEAWLMVSMMKDVVTNGHARRARCGAGFHMPAGGKTGTTNDYTDVWFIGYTADLVAGVWMGFDNPQKIMANAQGGRLAAPAWTSFMTRGVRAAARAARIGRGPRRSRRAQSTPARDCCTVRSARSRTRTPNTSCPARNPPRSARGARRSWAGPDGYRTFGTPSGDRRRLTSVREPQARPAHPVRTRYHARLVRPVAAPDVENGTVVVDGGLVAYVGPRGGAPPGHDVELGDVILAPGLVNAHTHLDLTVLRGALGGLPFFEWIRAVTAARTALTADALLASARAGVGEGLLAGITTFADTTPATRRSRRCCPSACGASRIARCSGPTRRSAPPPWTRCAGPSRPCARANRRSWASASRRTRRTR